MTNEMAQIALNQLTNSNNGGNRLVAMIGAKNFVRDEPTIQSALNSRQRQRTKLTIAGLNLTHQTFMM